VIVVSNTSPIINLAMVGRLDLLHQLYDKIIIPQAVYNEIVVLGSGQPGSKEIQNEKWFEVRAIKNTNLANALKIELDEGEAEAIALAVELKAGLLLLDEKLGRKAASRFGIDFIGLLGMIVDAKQRDIIPEGKTIIDNLIQQAGFWIQERLYHEILQTLGE